MLSIAVDKMLEEYVGRWLMKSRGLVLYTGTV